MTHGVSHGVVGVDAAGVVRVVGVAVMRAGRWTRQSGDCGVMRHRSRIHRRLLD